jgi:hypothetical protein
LFSRHFNFFWIVFSFFPIFYILFSINIKILAIYIIFYTFKNIIFI